MNLITKNWNEIFSRVEPRLSTYASSYKPLSFTYTQQRSINPNPHNLSTTMYKMKLLHALRNYGGKSRHLLAEWLQRWTAREFNSDSGEVQIQRSITYRMVQQRDHLRGDLVLIPVPDEFDCEITKLSSEERRWIPYLHMPKGRLYTKNNRLFQPKRPQLTMG